MPGKDYKTLSTPY